MEIKGIVSAISHKDGRFGIKIGENWFNGFGQAGCNKGDEILLTYEEDGKWKNVSDIKVLSANPTPGSNPTQAEFRPNVDAGNILQREIEFLNGLDLDLPTKTKILNEGNLGGYLVDEFNRIRNRLKNENV